MWGVPGMPALAARVVERNELGADDLRGQSGRRRTWLTLAVHGIDRGSAAADVLIERLVADGWRWIKVTKLGQSTDAHSK